MEEISYEEYEKKLKKIKKQNQKYLGEFEKWLKNKGLVKKTIRNHVVNADLYINEYLNYYEINEMKNGYHMINDFFEDWFIRKCLWLTAATVKSTAASIKKFYNCMQQLNYIDKESYKELCDEIKEGMEYWIDEVEEYNAGEDDW